VGEKIGLLGGTFDPIHIAHVFMGRLAEEELGLERVIYVPAGVPPHKEPGSVTAARHRLAMIKLAVGNERSLEVSDLELARQATSYTIDTVRGLRRALKPESRLYIIMGSDSLLEVDTWKEHEELMSLATLAVFPRPGYSVDAYHARGSKAVVVLASAGVGFDLCSSAIRERVRRGKSIRYLVPGAVEEYIIREGLYREG
jgi:nicotinate-nucleotide adenylyltransferase